MTYALTFRDELKKRIDESADDTISTLVSGNAQDYSHYKELCGLLRGMQIAANLCEEIADDLNRV